MNYLAYCRIWYMHDGMLPHFSIITGEFRVKKFRWIGPEAKLCYKILFIEDLRIRIIQSCLIIQPGILMSVRHLMLKILKTQIELESGHFEQLL